MERRNGEGLKQILLLGAWVVLLTLAGWLLVIEGQLGTIQGNRFTSADGLEIYDRIGRIALKMGAIDARLGAREQLEIPPRDVRNRLRKLEEQLELLRQRLEAMALENRSMHGFHPPGAPTWEHPPVPTEEP